MSRPSDYFFRFIVIGDYYMCGSILHDNFENGHYMAVPFRIRNERILLYGRRIGGMFFIQQGDFRNFIEQFPADYHRNAIQKVVSDFKAVIFTSKSLEESRQLLRESDRAELFATITKQMPVFVLVRKAKELKARRDYYQLFSMYFETTEDNIMIHQFGAFKRHKQSLMMILKDFLVLYARRHSGQQPNLSIFGICAICFDDQQRLVQFHDQYLICDSCDPHDLDKDKVRAWLKIDK